MFLARMAELSALFLWQEPEQEDTPLKDFFDTWKFKILVAVAVFLVGIMAYAGANGRLTAAPQELLSVVLTPFQKVTSALSGGIGSVWKKYTSIDDVMAQNEQLEAENAGLRPHQGRERSLHGADPHSGCQQRGQLCFRLCDRPRPAG